MSGYAVSARLHGGSTRFVAAGPDRRPSPSWPPAVSPASLDLECADPVARPLRDVLADHWRDLRDAWSQTTFYLFDPESWR